MHGVRQKKQMCFWWLFSFIISIPRRLELVWLWKALSLAKLLSFVRIKGKPGVFPSIRRTPPWYLESHLLKHFVVSTRNWPFQEHLQHFSLTSADRRIININFLLLVLTAKQCHQILEIPDKNSIELEFYPRSWLICSLISWSQLVVWVSIIQISHQPHGRDICKEPVVWGARFPGQNAWHNHTQSRRK